MSSRALLKYNFRVVMYNNWWILVFPVASSQLVVFWNLVTQRFADTLPVQTVELVSPLLGAFLCAHILTAEYQSRTGAVLASKPVHIGRVVVLRLLTALVLVWVLAAISLTAYYVGLGKYDVRMAAVACVPSTVFLSLLALTFATRFRNPMAGFGVAAIYWALDLPPGAPLNALLSLKSLTTSLQANVGQSGVFSDSWWVTKGVLLVLAAALYVVHSRLVFGLGAPSTVRARRRAAIQAVVIVLFYIYSGAAIKVAYGYAHRGLLAPDDLVWFRQQFAPYGPIPVRPLFGSAFVAYLGTVPGSWRLDQESGLDRWGDTPKHREALQRVLNTQPNSIWAPSIADALVRLETHRGTDVNKHLPYYHIVTDRYPNSPYMPYALHEEGVDLADAGRDAEARQSYEAMLKFNAAPAFKSQALGYLTASDQKQNNLPAARAHALEWEQVAPLQDRFKASLALAGILKLQGDLAGAKQAAGRVMKAVTEFRTADLAHEVDVDESQLVKIRSQATQAAAAARSY